MLLAVMVILASFASISAQTDKYIEPAAIKAFENNDSRAEIFVRYNSDIPINESNEREMLDYYRNSTVTKTIFSYIPEAEMNITITAISALAPSFVAIATKDGFEKLVNDSRVIEIQLERETYLADAPTENTSENQTCTPSVFIDPRITAALQNNESVYVGVGIRDTSGIVVDYNLPKEEKINLLNQIEEYKKNISEQIRANLTAAEFNVTRVAIDGTVFFGSITKKGLEKLNSSCYIKNIAIPLRGSGAENQENQTLPSVDPAIIPAFENSTRVRVLVRLIDVSNITVEGTKEQRRNLSNTRYYLLREYVDTFLASFPQTEISNIRRHSGEFTADITKRGLDILSSDSRVTEIILAYTGGSWGIAAEDNSNISASQNNTIENQTQSPHPEAPKPISFFQRIINFFKSLFGIKS